MKRISGNFITKKSPGELYKVYIPSDLPPSPPICLEGLFPLLDEATRLIGELNALVHAIPNTSLFIYMYVRKEALLSSQIEGTQSSFSDLVLFENAEKPTVDIADVEEVSNYVKAIQHAHARIKKGFPLSLRLLKEVHSILLSGSRGKNQLPGEFRRSQNWIGGTRPGNALFVPPPVDALDHCLSNLESFLHSPSLPVLIKAGIAHVQFETIHPFLDGNGRLGRLLVNLLFCNEHLLSEPILYLSLFLKQNRTLYYDLLQEVREHGTWETWLEFFLTAISSSAKQAIRDAQKMNQIFHEDASKIETLGRAAPICIKVFEYLKKLPQITPPALAEAISVSPPTARSALKHLQKLNIVQAIKAEKKGNSYVYRRYLDILEQGADAL